MRTLILVFHVLFAASPVCAFASAFDQSHASWTAILKKYVHVAGPASQVDYSGIKKDEASLNAYLQSLSAVTKSDFEKFSRAEQMAFLINAYNAFTIQIVEQHYPVKSIKDIGGFFRSTWKIKFFKLFGEEMNLDEIEHENLRKNFKDARVHFAINCASIGCPALRAEAYTAAKLNQQLDDQAKIFLHDSSRNVIDQKNMTLELSQIFRWFREDFERDSGTLQKFVARFADDPVIVTKIEKGEFKVKFLDYDWSLNQWKN